MRWKHSRCTPSPHAAQQKELRLRMPRARSEQTTHSRSRLPGRCCRQCCMSGTAAAAPEAHKPRTTSHMKSYRLTGWSVFDSREAYEYIFRNGYSRGGGMRADCIPARIRPIANSCSLFACRSRSRRSLSAANRRSSYSIILLSASSI